MPGHLFVVAGLFAEIMGHDADQIAADQVLGVVEDALVVEQIVDAAAVAVPAVDRVALVPGGFGERGTEGKIIALRHARTNNIPCFGICLGMQLMVVEYARTVLGLERANSAEFDEKTPDPVICLMPEQEKVVEKGATMRLGAYPCKLQPGSRAAEIYGSEEISERHRHRFEFNNDYRARLAEAGLVISGVSPNNHLVEMIELTEHPWYLGCQFHPEFKSRPTAAHPLFASYIATCVERSKARTTKSTKSKKG